MAYVPTRRSLSIRVAAWAGLAAGLSAALAAAAQPLDLPEHRDRGWLRARMTADADAGIPFDLDPHRVCSKQCLLHGYLEQGLNPDGSPARPPGPGLGNRGPGIDPTDVLHNALEIEVAPPGGSLTGSNTMTIVSNVDNLTSFTFRLRWNFTVTSCTVTDSVGAYAVSPTVPFSGSSPPSYGRTFTLQRPINQGQQFTVRVDYTGTLQEGVGLGSVVFGRQNNQSGAPGVVCTLSEPYYAATWWPCKDGDVFQPGDNADKATFSIAITAPQQYTSVANGVLLGVDALSGSRRRYRWATAYPMSTYLACFSTSQYNTFSTTYNHGAGVMPLQFFVYPMNDIPEGRNLWLSIPTMMEAFRPIFGLYPFINEKYGIYQFEFGGGMEHQTSTGQGGSGLFSESVTVHELAHQWWGDNITCRTWHDIWLNEGFATYAEALWQERRPGSSGPTALRNAMNARRPTDPSGSVYCFDIDNPARIFSTNWTYRKAGWVLHQLRHVVGDETFFNIIQTYRDTFDGGAATTAQFTSLASAVAGQNLDWFFDPWLYHGGAPVYEYGWENAVINGQNHLRLMVRQVQSSGPIFEMPIDVRISTPTGTITRIVRNDADLDHFLIPLPDAATAVTLDPDNWILEYGKTQVAYEQGPPKIVDLDPLPGLSISAASSPAHAIIRFSDNVIATSAAFSVTRDGATVPFTFSYDAPARTAMLDFGGPLPAGSYAVGIADSITSATGGFRLDGDLILLPDGSGVLPTGDGQPGGFTAYGFTVHAPACRADFNQSGDITVQDIFDFLAAYFRSESIANVNADDSLSVQDIFDYLAMYFGGCP